MERGMSTGETVFPESLDPTMIVPCGRNGGLCIGCLREKNRCSDCDGVDADKPRY